MLFLDEGQVMLLDDLMWDQGYLDSRQMSGAFQALRSDELIWGKFIREYVLGERDEMIGADGLERRSDPHARPDAQPVSARPLSREPPVVRDAIAVEGRKIALRDIRAPIFVVGMARDHIAPWRSVYKICLFTDTDVTFALASGGHNVGIVNPPAQMRGSYQLMTMGRERALRRAGHMGRRRAVLRRVVVAGLGGMAPGFGLGREVEPPHMGATEAGPAAAVRGAGGLCARVAAGLALRTASEQAICAGAPAAS